MTIDPEFIEALRERKRLYPDAPDAIVGDIPGVIPMSADPIIDIISFAEQQLADWINSAGGNAVAMMKAAPSPGGFVASILAFLKAILPMLGCVVPAAGQSAEEAQKQMVMEHPILARMRLTGLARRHSTFARTDIPTAVEASMHLLTVSTAAQYKAFALAA
jgi:hypothetical protein